MPCLFRYRWLKLPRTALPQGKGLSAYWARLAARAAFRKGVASYCGYENPVEPGMWSGGVVGLKSILGVKKRERALEILEQLSSHGYLCMQHPAMAFCVSPDPLQKGLLHKTTYLMKQTHGWISGATPYRWIRTMRFLFLLRFASTANTEFF